MSEPKFTKGPWRVVWPVPSADLCRKILAADNTAIMGDQLYYPWTPKSGHDWQLIAAAPEMYGLLDKLSDCDDLQMYKAEINALLAKARGEV